MKELLEKILGQIKKTPSGVRAYEDLYHICLETQKTDIPLSVEYLKKLSDIIENRIPQSETDKELRSLFMLHKKVLLAAAPFDFESYLLYVEWEREPDKKFYVPRREVMHPVVQAMQDLIDDRLDLLTISMPPGTGKSTLGIFFLSWVMGRFPDSQSLASAHSGMLTRSFYDGVYDLSVARLQEEALALGIEKKVSAMTQAEKSQLRYYAIMTQVTTAQGDMARTLNAPANQLRVLQAQVTQCARALGNIFIPALNAVLPYAIALAKIVRMLANSIASLFGFKLPEVNYSGISAGASAVGDLADNAGDASDGLGKAGKAAKKLKNALLGIDELNVLSKDDSSSGSGSGSGAGIGGGDLGIDLPTYDFLGDAITSKVDEIVQMIKDAMWEITAVISGFLLAIGTILVVTGANIPLGLGLMAVGAVGLAASVMANWNGMSERLAKVLTLVTGVLGGFLLAIGAFLVFSGVNVPLGAGLMVAGAAALGTAAVINWKFLNGDLSNALSILTAIVSGALLAMGALFAFTGVDVPLGIHESKEFLQELLEDIIEIANELGITVNTRKTRICKLSEHWRFLQVQYSLTDTGRVIQKINPKRLTAMRRKMKKLAPKLTEKEFTDFYKSWFKNHYKIMSKKQRSNMDTLFNQLKEVTKCTLSPLPMAKS